MRCGDEPGQVGLRVGGTVPAQPDQGQLGDFGQHDGVGLPATNLEAIEKRLLESELLPVEAGAGPTVFDHRPLGDVRRLGGDEIGELLAGRHRRPASAPQEPAQRRERPYQSDIMSHGQLQNCAVLWSRRNCAGNGRRTSNCCEGLNAVCRSSKVFFRPSPVLGRGSSSGCR